MLFRSKGEINKCDFRGTLVPRKGSKYALFLNQEIRKLAGIKSGDLVEVKLEYDPESRELPTPIDLEDALSQNAEAIIGFNNFSASHKREMISWINDAKRVETREKRINKAVEHCVEYFKKKQK